MRGKEGAVGSPKLRSDLIYGELLVKTREMRTSMDTRSPTLRKVSGQSARSH